MFILAPMMKIYTRNRKGKKTFMAPFYGWGSTDSRLQSHYEKTVYCLAFNSQELVVLN